MKRLETVEDVRTWRGSNDDVGLIPTMGALHEGHLSLVERSKQECARTAVSIFVNPTQFNDPKDLERYPRPIEDDLALLEKQGVDAVFLPKPEEIYRDGYRFHLTETRDSQGLCGAARPGHFDGVLTVVMKLFQIVQPSKAFFGEKDFQQLTLIRGMAEAFFLNTRVIGCPTLREADGLAMSSRNRLLTPADREKAPLLYRALKTNDQAALEAAGFKIDYFEERWGRRLGAAFLGRVRLIDNVEI